MTNINTIIEEEKKKYTQWDMDNEYVRGYNEGASEPKIVMYATANDGDGMTQRIGTYESIEDIVIHTGMFNNVEISFEYERDRSEGAIE